MVNKSRFSLGLVLLLCNYAPSSLFADELIIEVQRSQYFLYEPIVIDVHLRVDQADQILLTRLELDRKFERRLKGRLMSDGIVVAEAMLGGGGFAFDPEEPLKSHASLLGCFGNKKPGLHQLDFEFWNESGDYELVVLDIDYGLQSNRVKVSFVRPPSEAAASAFALGGTTTLQWLFDPDAPDDDSLFKKLASEYHHTVYGKYAKACLALHGISAGKNTQETIGVWNRDICSALRESVEDFPSGHPMRNRVLLKLGQGAANPGASVESQTYIQKLMLEARDSTAIQEAKRLTTRAIGNRGSRGE